MPEVIPPDMKVEYIDELIAKRKKERDAACKDGDIDAIIKYNDILIDLAREKIRLEQEIASRKESEIVIE